MDAIKNFFKKKYLGFWFTIASFVLLILSIILFALLSSSSEVIDETPSTIFALLGVAAAVSLVVGYKDFFHAVSIIQLLFVSVVTFLFIYGRVSYLAYYFSGDIMGTGLSVWFIVTFILLLATLVSSILAICFKQEKNN